MTKKEYILDCLVDDDEAKTQILEFFQFAEVDISEAELDLLLTEMLTEGFIEINREWENEQGENPYSLTAKGRCAWENID